MWTLSRIQKLVAEQFGVSFSISHLHRVVTGLGFTPQKPERRSREQDVEAVKEFRGERWPALGKGRGTRGGHSS
ncbi:MAG: winged helix-turn-helix domain-containing protein [Sandaracinaceae bacterium]|nr:winged helix-turn-helix domain-containing protein [Sandaracinaceae bacterium]